MNVLFYFRRLLHSGGLVLLFTGLLAAPVAAQDFDEWRQQQEQAFQDYVDEQNARFAEFLRKNWEDFDTEAPEPVPEEAPKPVQTPTAPEPEEDVAPPELPPVPPLPPAPEPAPAEPEPEPEPEQEPEPEPEPEMPAAPAGESMRWHYYEVPFVPLKNSEDFSLGQLSNDALADAWLEMAQTNFEEVLETLKTFTAEQQINEWGYALLVKDYARKVFENHNEAVFLSWFLLHNSGFHANGGYRGGELFLLMPVSEKLFEVSYYTLDEALPRFYVMQAGHSGEAKPGSIHTYKPDQEQPLRVLDMSVTRAPANSSFTREQPLQFSFGGREYEIRLGYDRNFVSLLEAFPLMRPEVMFATPASPRLHQQLEQQIEPVIEQMTTQQALNFLLRFTQKAFEYQTDTEQFGHQKYMTPDQILYHAYSDCDDRSIFFAYLVRNFMNRDVIAVSWPGHLATAVEASEEFEGDRITIEEKTYLICDPTYIGADSGLTMPQFVNQPVQAHPFNDLLSYSELD